MVSYAIDESQRKAAKIVGFTYLFAMITANFAEIYVPSRLIVRGNTAETVANILTHERLFRLGIASDLATFATDVVLIAALYIVLRPVSKGLALVAAFWRLIETSIMVFAALNHVGALRVLSGADYLSAFEPNRLQALAELHIGGYGAAYQVGLLFLGLGSAVFAYLWFDSRYIPRLLAGWGIFASLLIVAYIFSAIVFPELPTILELISLAPIAIFELTMGLWLLIRGLAPAQNSYS